MPKKLEIYDYSTRKTVILEIPDELYEQVMKYAPATPVKPSQASVKSQAST